MIEIIDNPIFLRNLALILLGFVAFKMLLDLMRMARMTPEERAKFILSTILTDIYDRLRSKEHRYGQATKEDRRGK